MISEDLELLRIEIVSLVLQRKYHDSHLKIMCWVVPFMILQLVRGISYNIAMLHKDTIQPRPTSITVHSESTTSRRQRQHRS